jgi:DNA-directed RNA polymerase specialized sigma24 family protein
MLAEDLAQEGREAAIRRLRQDLACPVSHLVVKARDAIYHYRRKGSSVDGKFCTDGRAQHYQIVSLEEPMTDDGCPREEVIRDPRAPTRVTEEKACANILVDCLRNCLSAEENQAVALRLIGIPWQEVGEILGQGRPEFTTLRERITTTAHVSWRLPMTEQEDNLKEKRAYTQTPPLPKELPVNLLAVLTDQERQAVEAYQQGTSQEAAAQQSGLSQATVSRLLAFVWEGRQKPHVAITPRTTRIKRHDRPEKLAALFRNRPAGKLVTYEELRAIFSDAKNPQYALWMAISR